MPSNDDPGPQGPPPWPWGSPGGNGAKADAPRQKPRPKPGGGGGGPGGGGPRRPGNPFGGGWPPGGRPDIDQIISRLQARLREYLPGGGGSARGLLLLGLGVAALWLATGFYRVQPDEQGVVLRFGAYNRTTLPGLNYHIPWPVESVDRPVVTRINRIEIGYRSGTGDSRLTSGRDAGGQDVLEESLMLTGDENIVDIDLAVLWKIRDPVAFLFNVREPPNNPSAVVKAVAESAMREVIGRTPIQPALTGARAQIEADVLKETQTILDTYGAGVDVTQVLLQKVDPPAAVIDSFRDVQRANTDAETVRNEAESYRNDIVPRAVGEAAKLKADADAARQASIAEARGQTQRFLEVYTAYKAAKDITMRRMYIETMEDVLSHSHALVLDGNLKGLVPFLQLNPADPNAGLPVAPAAKGGSR
jgi:membrane protease subunit HflK